MHIRKEARPWTSNISKIPGGALDQLRLELHGVLRYATFPRLKSIILELVSAVLLPDQGANVWSVNGLEVHVSLIKLPGISQN